MSTTQRKRHRANTKGEATDTNEAINSPGTTAPDIDYQSIIDTFDTPTIKKLLFTATQQSPTFAKAVVLKHQQAVAAEAKRVVDFDGFSKSTWRALADADKMKGSKAWDASFDVTASIERSVKKILSSTPAHASLGTKKSAVYTLRKMCKTIVLSREEICGHEVCKSLAEDETLENAMLAVVSVMDDEEKEVLMLDDEWIAKMEELIELGSGYGMYEKLGDVLDQVGAVESEE